MNTDKSDLLGQLLRSDDDESNGSALSLNQITEKIIGCSYTVSNVLGCGFLEKVYENALAHELRKLGFQALQQFPISVYYDNVIIGEYKPDIFVENKVIVEVKALRTMDDAHIAQCMNYLKATSLKIGLVINFGKPKVEIRRVIR